MKFKIKKVALSTATLYYPKYKKWYHFKYYFFSADYVFKTDRFDFNKNVRGYGHKCFFTLIEAMEFLENFTEYKK